MIEAHDVVVHHHQSDPVLDGVSMTVVRSELVGLIGPNGGGKSTLMGVLTRRIPMTEGRLVGEPRVGLVLAQPGLYPSLTVRENLVWFAQLSAPEGWPERLSEATSQLGLTSVLEQRADTLSSGQAQRAALVRALATQPDLLVLDEPTANIDPRSAQDIHRRLRAEADGGRAVLLCSHDLSAVEQICDRVLYLDRRILHEQIPQNHASTSSLLALFPEHASSDSVLFTPSPGYTPLRAALHRELLELRRHPATLGVAVVLFVLVGALCTTVLLLLAGLHDPTYAETLSSLTDTDAHAFLTVASAGTRTAMDFLMFSQYLGFIGVLSAQAWLHERSLGTLPFLETSGVPMSTFVRAKALAAWVPLTSTLLLVTTLTTTALLAFGDPFPSVTWWLRNLVTQPIWGLAVAFGGLTISEYARDVRQAQQTLWFVLFGLQSTVAFGIAQLHDDPAAQCIFSALGLGVIAGFMVLRTDSSWNRSSGTDGSSARRA